MHLASASSVAGCSRTVQDSTPGLLAPTVYRVASPHGQRRTNTATCPNRLPVPWLHHRALQVHTHFLCCACCLLLDASLHVHVQNHSLTDRHRHFMGDLQSVNDVNDAVASSDVHPLWVDRDVFVIMSAFYPVDAGILELPDNAAIAVEPACAAHTAQKPQQNNNSSAVSGDKDSESGHDSALHSVEVQGRVQLLPCLVSTATGAEGQGSFIKGAGRNNGCDRCTTALHVGDC